MDKHRASAHGLRVRIGVLRGAGGLESAAVDGRHRRGRARRSFEFSSFVLKTDESG